MKSLTLCGSVHAPVRLMPTCVAAGTLIATPDDGAKPIEELRVGDRVATTNINPILPDGSRPSIRSIGHLEKLRMSNPSDPGDIYEIETLRPLEWILEHDAFPGRTIEFETERSPIDQAYVDSVEKAPAIARGSGRVVLSTFTHRDQILTIRFEGVDKPLDTTPTHRLYSVERGEWVLTSTLRAGDRVRTSKGEAKIASLEQREVARVFDIEVETDHAYFVAGADVLSHNCGGTGAKYDKARGQGIYVLIDPQTREVKYVGRGDAPARIATHQRDPIKGRLEAHIIANNNLTKAHAKALEQRLIGTFGGARSVNPATNTLNKIRSFSPMNKNASKYKQSLSPQQWREAQAAVRGARRGR